MPPPSSICNGRTHMPKLRVSNFDLHYTEAGRGDPLLLIHGLGSSSRDWERQISVFAEHFHVIACDLRGHGQSDKPAAPYVMRDFADDLASLILSLREGPMHVVGI